MDAKSKGMRKGHFGSDFSRGRRKAVDNIVQGVLFIFAQYLLGSFLQSTAATHTQSTFNKVKAFRASVQEKFTCTYCHV